MSSCLFLTRGLNKDNNMQIIVTTNTCTWDGYTSMEKWTIQARISTLSPTYQRQVRMLTNLVRENIASLSEAYHHPKVPSTKDESLRAAWLALLHVLVAKDPHGYALFTVDAMAHFILSKDKRSRCRRCRTIFQFKVEEEPDTFREGPFSNGLSCAEVLGYWKSSQLHLH